MEATVRHSTRYSGFISLHVTVDSMLFKPFFHLSQVAVEKPTESPRPTETAKLAVEQSSGDEVTETPFASDLEPDTHAAEKVAQGSGHVPAFLESSVEGLSPRLKNCVVRVFMSVFMISGFLTLIYLGPLALVLLVRYRLILFIASFISFGLKTVIIVGLHYFFRDRAVH